MSDKGTRVPATRPLRAPRLPAPIKTEGPLRDPPLENV